MARSPSKSSIVKTQLPALNSHILIIASNSSKGLVQNWIWSILISKLTQLFKWSVLCTFTTKIIGNINLSGYNLDYFLLYYFLITCWQNPWHKNSKKFKSSISKSPRKQRRTNKKPKQVPLSLSRARPQNWRTPKASRTHQPRQKVRTTAQEGHRSAKQK